MFQFLTQPYPSDPRDVRQWLLTSAGAGLFVASFLLVFQPFGSSQWHDPVKPYVLAGYGLVTFACLAGAGLVFPKIFKSTFNEANWTVGREIFWTLTVIVLIALSNMLYSRWAFGGEIGLASTLTWLGITAAVGVIPTTVIILLNYVRLLRRYAAGDLAVHPRPTNPQLPESLNLVAENEKDSLSMPVDDLLFIQSADNYSEVVFLKKDKIGKTLLRGSLSRFEEQAHHPDVVRCHRSYIVNLQQVESISGNAQGYRLQLRDYPSPIPVARRYGDLVASYFRK